MNVIEDLSDT